MALAQNHHYTVKKHHSLSLCCTQKVDKTKILCHKLEPYRTISASKRRAVTPFNRLLSNYILIFSFCPKGNVKLNLKSVFSLHYIHLNIRCATTGIRGQITRVLQGQHQLLSSCLLSPSFLSLPFPAP